MAYVRSCSAVNAQASYVLLRPGINAHAHQSWGSYLDIEDDEGIKDLDGDDAATWLNEKVGTHHLHEMCFEMEQEIDLNVAAVMEPLAEARKPLVIDVTRIIDVNTAPTEVEQNLDTAWDW
ncbi:hypothetical protein PAXINDRAFT_12014 [Paxillus involutus ATCC 200175]|uniref:Uncharacterized protein n=1 Tax=Paxillus involutus ATCC 200175 TaxID=664439 RepID=A0A0C9U6Q9_PAXIN|nr:hypothetical protein PAXINDRAFT_12014 [Paxillus involutus ATCC 200175]